jgi:hypothetical protein
MDVEVRIMTEAVLMMSWYGAVGPDEAAGHKASFISHLTHTYSPVHVELSHPSAQRGRAPFATTPPLCRRGPRESIQLSRSALSHRSR